MNAGRRMPRLGAEEPSRQFQRPTPGYTGCMAQTIARRVAPARLRQETLPRLLLLLILAAVAGTLGRLLPLAAADFGIAGLFSTDEELAGAIVFRMVDERTLSPDHFFAYGALYHELAALVALPAAFDGLQQREVLIALRLVSLAGGLATLALTYALGRSLYGAWAGVLAAGVLALSTELATWSVTAHPDTLQLALLCGTLLAATALTRRYRTRTLLLAALLAGLAFAVKYLGVMLLPLIVLAALAGAARSGPWGRPGLLRLTRDGVLALATFALAFVATNPYAVVEWRRFLTQLRAEIGHARAGHVFVDTGSGWEWLGVIVSPSFLPFVIAVIAAASTIAVLIETVRRPQPPPSEAGPRAWLSRIDGRVLLVLWTGGYLLYLVAQIGYLAPRHALPLAPGLAVLAAGATTRVRAPQLRRLAMVALVLVAVLIAFESLRGFSEDRVAREGRIDSDDRVVAGRWLRETYAPQTVILRDAYAYIPPSFPLVSTTFGLTAGELAAVRPHLVVVNEAIRGRFRNPADAARYIDGEPAFRQRAQIYADLEQPGQTFFILVRNFGSVQIYEGRAQAGRPAGVEAATIPGCD